MTGSSFLVRATVLAIAAISPVAAFGQAGWVPADEVVGQPIQVTTNGITNTVYLDSGGQLRIVTPGGNTVAGTWTAANKQLCLGLGDAQECIPYNAPFQAQQPQTFTSSCSSVSTWVAQVTNVQNQQLRGERGR